jgi:hypothetical protein
MALAVCFPVAVIGRLHFLYALQLGDVHDRAARTLKLALCELSSDRRLDRQYLKERSHRSERG